MGVEWENDYDEGDQWCAAGFWLVVFQFTALLLAAHLYYGLRSMVPEIEMYRAPCDECAGP